MRVFVSYRRDDAGGHAGRLADDLAERMPGATVFQDVESIGPGADFVAAIQQAIARADVVLIVIGPDWATIEGPTGALRLGQPDDVVRLEVASALDQAKWVIPVLVGNAVMPDPGTLPAEVAPLARRNAVEVRPEAWDADVARLVASLGPPTRSRSTAPIPVGSHRWVGPAVALGVLALLALVVLVWRPWSEPVEAGDGDVDGTSEVTSVDDGGGGGGGGSALELPSAAGTLLHGGTGARLGVDVTSASLTGGSQPVLRLTTHIVNPGAYDAYLDAGDLRLEADGRSVSPRNDTGIGIVSRSEIDVPLDFDLPVEPEELVLVVRFWDDVGEIPLLGPRTSTVAEPPELRAEPAPVSIADVQLQIGPATIQGFSDRFVVSVPVGVTNAGDYDMNFWDRSFRMLVDGVLTPPVSALNDVVRSRSTGEATLEWDVALDVGELVFLVEDWGGSAEIPLTSG